MRDISIEQTLVVCNLDDGRESDYLADGSEETFWDNVSLILARVAGRDLDQVVIWTTELANSAYSTINNRHACTQEPKEG